MALFGLFGKKGLTPEQTKNLTQKHKYKIGTRVAWKADPNITGRVIDQFLLTPEDLHKMGYKRAPAADYRVLWDDGTRGIPHERQLIPTNRKKQKVKFGTWIV